MCKTGNDLCGQHSRSTRNTSTYSCAKGLVRRTRIERHEHAIGSLRDGCTLLGDLASSREIRRLTPESATVVLKRDTPSGISHGAPQGQGSCRKAAAMLFRDSSLSRRGVVHACYVPLIPEDASQRALQTTEHLRDRQ